VSNYRCENGHKFTDEEAVCASETTRSEAWGQVTVTTETFWCCPICGSDEVEEIND
jgi:RNA polymerase subunit RPABC4/transcription elongation factor Spt4